MDGNNMQHYYKLTNSNSATKRHFLIIAHSFFFNDFTRVIFEMVNLVNNISI